MKNTYKLLMTAIIAIGLTACGSGNNNTTTGGALTGPGIYGSNGQSLAAGGCQAISASTPLTFAVSNAYIDNTRLAFGSMFQPAVGQIAMNATSMSGSITFDLKTAHDNYGMPTASMQLFVSPTITGNSASATVTGTLQLTPAVVQSLINSSTQMGIGAPCVTSVTLDGVQLIQQAAFNPGSYGNYGVPSQGVSCQGACTGNLMSGMLYLTLNNGQNFGPLHF